MIIAMIMKFLSGTMNIKNARLKKHNKRRFNAHCLAPIKMLGLLHARRRKEMDNRNIWLVKVMVSDGCFWLSDMST